ncbi:hypothetical protein [Luteimonas notoginsengisoli]|uniref:Uncharacterized protein n=1 Tax=Luteimonas notoginsengisoli TaxID=1578200 RepID=A0ABV7URW9_9GAMM
MQDAADLSRLAENTSRYARYSRSAGGLSLVIGGVLCLATFVVGATVELTPALRYLLVGAPLAWLLSKELLRAFYYQRAGAARERLSDKQRRMRRWMVAYLAAMSLLIIAGVAWTAGTRAWQWPGIAYIAIVAAMPLVAARWFWSVGDFLVGVLLVCQAAVVIVGLHYPWYWILIAAIYAAIAVTTGWREHRDYLQLRDELGLSDPGRTPGRSA